ncbi:hypothetical protein TEA_025775 [Camellia sinensis var. sinensis]|uniref:Uncharacterized protein n=1 Tax=Camellia sinensis var. sinensis TaxID=542762 RepID=A0A4S4E700_CAMSN|nr:hypothetical protein TEA_025775 [Camellia sinensis var. sinensis]
MKIYCFFSAMKIVCNECLGVQGADHALVYTKPNGANRGEGEERGFERETGSVAQDINLERCALSGGETGSVTATIDGSKGKGFVLEDSKKLPDYTNNCYTAAQSTATKPIATQQYSGQYSKSASRV